MSVILFLAGFVVIACPLIAVSAYWIFVWSQSLTALEGWADKEGYRIVQRSYRTFLRGPFSLMPATCTVFYVTVQDRDGFERDGWVCCGDQYYGTSDKPEVEWRANP
jgi:hypothetical protein